MRQRILSFSGAAMLRTASLVLVFCAAPAAFAWDLPPLPQRPAAANNISPEMRGDIYMARKMYREAAEAYKMGPSDSAVLLNKTGIAYHEMVQLGIAKKYYERALKINPHFAEASNNLGTIYYARKSYRRAIRYYKRALKDNPDSACIYSNLGTAYFARKKYPLAMAAYGQALTLDPDVFEHSSSVGVLLQERTIGDRAMFHLYEARLYARRGMTDRALLCIRKALEEGLKDRKKIETDPDFKQIRDLPAFKELLAMQPRVL